MPPCALLQGLIILRVIGRGGRVYRDVKGKVLAQLTKRGPDLAPKVSNCV